MRLTLALAILWFSATSIPAAEDLESRFQGTVRPFLKTYCLDCHDQNSAEGDLELDADNDLASVVDRFRRWMVVMDRLDSADMPPPDADLQPSVQQRQDVMRWISDVRDVEAKRRRGDPGIVPARRLSNAEYDNTIRDLTGQDLRPASEFPIDPANQEGFDNSGESLTMSPSRLNKYLEAARNVSDHLVLTPSGIDFSPHPVITDTDRDKFCVNRIIDFYRQQSTDYGDFFFALWEFQQQTADGREGEHSLDQFATERGLSPRYMWSLSEMLSGESLGEGDRTDNTHVGPLAAIRSMWKKLPRGNNSADRDAARRQCEQIEAFVTGLRRQLVPAVKNLTTPEVHNGSQPLVLWKNRQFAANRRRYAGGANDVKELGLKPGSQEDRAMQVPVAPELRQQYEAAFEQFCSLFPDHFVVSQRARVYLDPKKEKERTGRYLSAGFHSQMGYFRDDQPLYDLILSDQQRKELDRLWSELDFVTSAPMRQYAGFIWFDRTDSRFMRDSQFDHFRAEDKDCTSEVKVRALAEAYLEKAKRVGGNPDALRAIARYFDDMSETFRRLERLESDSIEVQIESLLEFAGDAFRRPLAKQERQSIRDFYQGLRDQSGLSHDAAMRDSLVAILMSPKFCYRLDSPGEAGKRDDDSKIVPLDSCALASRLSYFLWASMPDQQLMALAESGELLEPVVLREQVGRMLRDEKVAGFVREFGGNWLGFRRFQHYKGVDRGRFPDFSDDLRQAMYEEPIRLITEIVKHDRSVLDLLYADYTFVNPTLANHYGIPQARIVDAKNGWGIVHDVDEFDRGGIMPMAVFLATNSPGLRTSPVKRGNWLVKQILGQHIPAPPAAVPELPSDESELGELTLRETLELHRADPSCAACHDKIDSFGLVFERFGPIGERRKTDLGGREVDHHAVFPDGSRGAGVAGLRDYIRRQRQDDFVETLCRKSLSYGLARSLQLSDEPMVTELVTALKQDNFRFRTIAEMIVTSPAFLNKRVVADLQ